MTRLVLLVALLALLAGCGEGGGDGDGVTTFENPRGTLEVAPGQGFRVVLPENPSTGYLWRFSRRPDRGVARLVGSDFELEPGGEDRDGAGGDRVLTFAAGGRGRTTMVLVNEFSGGEAGRRPAATRRLTVRVR